VPYDRRDALDRDNVAGYNCSYIPIDNVKAFDEVMYILMCGTGVGFSVERQYINKLPEVPTSSMLQTQLLELLIPRSDGPEEQENSLPCFTLVKSLDGTYKPSVQRGHASSHLEAAQVGLSHLKISFDSLVIPLDVQVDGDLTHWSVTISFVRLPISSYVEGSDALH